MADDFQFDVFLSHSAKDKVVVRPLAERLRQDGLKAVHEFGFRISESGFARPGMSTNAFGTRGLSGSNLKGVLPKSA
jgi:hypothetical protein